MGTSGWSRERTVHVLSCLSWIGGGGGSRALETQSLCGKGRRDHLAAFQVADMGADVPAQASFQLADT